MACCQKQARRDCLKFSVFEAAGHPDLVQVTETVTQDFFLVWMVLYDAQILFRLKKNTNPFIHLSLGKAAT